MSFFTNMINLQLMLFSLIAVGVLTKRIGIVDQHARKALSNLLIFIILPCSIVQSFIGTDDVSASFLISCIQAIVLSMLIQLFAINISKVIFAKFDEGKKSVLSYGLITSNSSFIGIPIAESLYGSMGVLYTSIFQIPIRITMWTAGLSLFTDVKKRDAYRKVIKHPCIIAIFVGFILMLAPITLPTFMTSAIKRISQCSIPVSMIVIGAILSDADLKTLFSPAVLFFTAIRLIIFPVSVYFVLMPFHLDPLLVNICVIMTGMPAGSTTSILADTYKGDSMFASQITFVSTLFSIFTIPMLSLLFA
ncbi:AEC family transporter [Fusibacter paucivorans]|uniref:AEC family transporter n=1 Tax=Fusibacter paucivorans TaxID=76009 RepID=A0ABS5PML8_9FIRM|nr:AEC family transporter [Fusibacter paucivorans]MBS7526308.1 AEC family transporter [Fusibacter paucivorans]